MARGGPPAEVPLLRKGYLRLSLRVGGLSPRTKGGELAGRVCRWISPVSGWRTTPTRWPMDPSGLHIVVGVGDHEECAVLITHRLTHVLRGVRGWRQHVGRGWPRRCPSISATKRAPTRDRQGEFEDVRGDVGFLDSLNYVTFTHALLARRGVSGSWIQLRLWPKPKPPWERANSVRF